MIESIINFIIFITAVLLPIFNYLALIKLYRKLGFELYEKKEK